MYCHKLKMHNRLMGYAFIVDWMGSVRWRYAPQSTGTVREPYSPKPGFTFPLRYIHEYMFTYVPCPCPFPEYAIAFTSDVIEVVGLQTVSLVLTTILLLLLLLNLSLLLLVLISWCSWLQHRGRCVLLLALALTTTRTRRKFLRCSHAHERC